MFNIAYIEPCSELILHKGRAPHSRLNINLHKRLAGIEQAVTDNSDVLFYWINNLVSEKSFIKDDEFKAYDATIFTAPSDEILSLIHDRKDESVFIISHDGTNDTEANFVGPDLYGDVVTVLDHLQKKTINKIYLVASHTYEKTKCMYNYFCSEMQRRNIPFSEEQLIGLELLDGSLSVCDFKGLNKSKYISKQIIKVREKDDAFIYLDDTGVLTVYNKLITDHGIDIPGDMHLVPMQAAGLFPSTFSTITPHLNLMSQDYYKIGLTSIQIALDILRKKKSPNGNQVLIPGKFSPCFGDDNDKDYKNENEIFRLNLENYLNRHYAEDLRADTLAVKLELNYSYFLTKFKMCFGLSLSKYINNIRLDKAGFLIGNSDTPLTEIYMSVGFTNESTFLRHFKNRFDMLPSEYRQQMHKIK